MSRKDTFIFLASCSRRSLGDFLLSRLETNQKLVKDLLLVIEESIDRIAENRAEIMLADLLRDHGEEIVERLGSAVRSEPQKVETLGNVGKRKRA